MFQPRARTVGSFGERQRVDAHLALLVMQFQVETIGEQCPHRKHERIWRESNKENAPKCTKRPSLSA
jgi:hypothetical protein